MLQERESESELERERKKKNKRERERERERHLWNCICGRRDLMCAVKMQKVISYGNEIQNTFDKLKFEKTNFLFLERR